jgi:hypothetical protein
MPIRFRCAYCNQLLGIARRKAGSVVRCPTCAGQVIVPNVEMDDAEAASEEPLVFERSDFEELLNPNEAAAAQQAQQRRAVLSSSESPVALPLTAEPPPGAWGTHAEPALDVSRIQPPPAGTASPAGGIVLSPTKATTLLVVAIVALALAFAMGFLLGYFVRPATGPTTAFRQGRLAIWTPFGEGRMEFSPLSPHTE